MSNTIEMVTKDVLFRLFAMEASGGFSKSSFGLVVSEYRLRLADEEGRLFWKYSQEVWLW